MHQPDYRDHATGEFELPWVYLHALKDYNDMAWHLERHPGMRAVVNFAPVLLDQLDDYADQFATNRLRDRLLRLLVHPGTAPFGAGERVFMLDRCFHTNHERTIRPFPAYQALLEAFQAFERHGAEGAAYLSDAYFSDLVTWYHLGWTGESLRRESDVVRALIAKARGFTPADRRALFEVVAATLRDVVPRWKRLAARGQVELSTTPEHHPLAPLLLDFASAREALPDCPLPSRPYPGGPARVAAHIDAALEGHRTRFGVAAAGIWPAEGAVSDALLRLFADRGVRWTASGGQVLRNSLAARDGTEGAYSPHRPWYVGESRPLACFFRDDFLSDRIGFEYARWNGDDAAGDLMAGVAAIGRAASDGETPIVSIILDGENCWEYYAYNGYYFLDALYRGLSAHPSITPTTFAAWLDRRAPADANAGPTLAPGALPRLVAGSWVAGTFSTWIGSPEKNHAWELLIAAKARYDSAGANLSPERLRCAQRQLAACEASDWFWWLSSANPAEAVSELERLFRMHVANLYMLLGASPPATLAQPIAHGAGAPEAGGTMRRATERAA
jgi:alpha-amylase/alpha-mannosidase (GH57 family)